METWAALSDKSGPLKLRSPIQAKCEDYGTYILLYKGVQLAVNCQGS